MSGIGIDISMTGEKELAKRLLKLPSTLQRKIVRPALRAALKPVLAEVKAAAPEHSGAVKKALKVRVPPKRKNQSRRVIRIAIVIKDRISVGIGPESKFFYPAHVELGTRKAPRGWSTGRPPNPFMRGPFERNRSAINRRVAAGIRAGIQKHAGKA